MAVFNGSKYLEQAINSILKQTYSNFEFIIIDDGSTDKTCEIVNRYMKIDDRIIFLRQGHHGLAHSLNFGISKAKGKYIARMDADDISHYMRFEKQIYFLENRDIDVVGSNITYIDKNGKLLGKIEQFPENDIEIKWNLSFTNPIAHPTVLMKKSIFTNGESYDINYKYCQDYALWNRISSNYKFYNIQEILLKFRLKKNDKKIDRQMDYIVKTQQSLLRQQNPDNTVENTLSFNSLINNKLDSKDEFREALQILMGITRSFILRSQIRSINECYRIHTLFPNTFKKVLINNGQLSFFLSLQIIGILVYYNSNVLLTKDFWWSIKIWIKKILNIAITNVSKSKTIINRNILYKPKKGIT